MAEEDFEPTTEFAPSETDMRHESANVCRVAAIGAKLSGVENEDLALDALNELGIKDLKDLRRQRGGPWGTATSIFLRSRDGSNQAQAWDLLQESGDAYAAVSFLMGALRSSSERETMAAAAALFRIAQSDLRSSPYFPDRFPANERIFRSLWRDEPWDPDRWSLAVNVVAEPDQPRTIRSSLLALCQARIYLGMRSLDGITKMLAEATTVPPGNEPVRTGTADSSHIPEPPSVSTIVHGTAAWKGTWWRPAGEFFAFAKSFRPDLFSEGARYSWSGSLDGDQRRLASEDLVDWAGQMAVTGLRTVFAHSYGGEVLARAMNAGLRVTEPVLLSVPTSMPVRTLAASGTSVFDVRLPFDPILALALQGQRRLRGSNVTCVRLRWSLDHGASHDPIVWDQQDILHRLGLPPEADRRSAT